MTGMESSSSTPFFIVALVAVGISLVDLYLGYHYGRKQADSAWRKKLEQREEQFEEQIRFLGRQFGLEKRNWEMDYDRRTKVELSGLGKWKS